MIGTEQERDALMAAVTDAITETLTRLNVRDCKSLGSMAGKEAGAVIRAMLAPPEDAELRERIREAVKDGMFVHKDRLKDGSVKEIIDSTADSVWAVLRGEATRDE